MTDGRFHVVPLCQQDVPAFVQPFWDTHYHSLIGRWLSPKLGFPTRLRCPIVPSRKHRGYEAFSLARSLGALLCAKVTAPLATLRLLAFNQPCLVSRYSVFNYII